MLMHPMRHIDVRWKTLTYPFKTTNGDGHLAQALGSEFPIGIAYRISPEHAIPNSALRQDRSVRSDMSSHPMLMPQLPHDPQPTPS